MSCSPLPNFLTIKESSIHNLGLFDSSKIKKDKMIGITYVRHEAFENNYIRTSLGGFINHSNNPNCELRESDNVYFILYLVNKIKNMKKLN